MVNPGERINIPCSVMHPGGSVQWIRNGKPILLDFSPTQRRHWNISNEGQASLTINRVTKTDEGIWECWELDSLGNVKQKAHVMKLVVTNLPEEPFLQMDGKRLPADAKITVRENNALTLECIVRGASPAVRQMSWFISGQNVTQSSELFMDYSTKDDSSEARSVLLVNVTKQEHTKRVICQAEHISWQHPAVVSASFNVLYEPSFTISREPGFGYPIIEGMAVALKCAIDANPASKPQWIKSGEKNSSHRITSGTPSSATFTTSSTSAEPVTAEGILNFSSIKVIDSGWYRCVTDHEFGHFESFGYYLNVRTQLPKLQHVLKLPLSPPSSPSHSENSAINKEHKHDAFDQFGFKDYTNPLAGEKPTQPASAKSLTDLMFNSGYPSTFHNQQQPNVLQSLNDVDCGDSNGRPIAIARNRTVIAITGKQITLFVDFCCNPRPRRVYWIHRHLAMAPNRIIGPYKTSEVMQTDLRGNCYTSQFTIDVVKPEDRGEIVFIVSNAKGLGDAVMQLNVTMASFSVSKVSSSYARWSVLLDAFIVATVMVLK